MILKEGGKAIQGSSQIPKAFLHPTVKHAIKKLELKDSDYDVVGNISAQFLGDIDIALNVEDLIKHWNLPTPAFSKEFWSAIKEKLGPSAKINVGLKQFHIPTEILNSDGKQQPAYKDGEPVEGTSGLVQLDFFIGSRNWMRDILSGKPEGSQYKAVFRNVLLTAIISNMKDRTPVPSKDEPGVSYSYRYSLDFKNGVEDVIDRITPPVGRQKVPQIQRGFQRTIVINSQDQLAAWLFGTEYKWSDINSFEKLVDAYTNSDHFNSSYAGKHKDDIKAKFREELTDEQLTFLNATPMSMFLEETLNEAREAIGRFSGDSQFSNPQLFELLRNLVKETGNVGKESFIIDLITDKTVDMVEKMDASFMHFGINPKGEFFMESNYSGEVTVANVKEKFGFKKDSYESFLYLQKNKKFQKALSEIYRSFGAVRFDSEMFPVFTHEGTKTGDITFASTRYKKEKFGKFGAFVIFKCSLFDKNENDWKRPDPSLNSTIISKFKELSATFDSDWKIYSNDDDMKLPGKIKVELGELSVFLDDKNYQSSLEALKDRKSSDLKKRIVSFLNPLREQLQQSLNDYANNTSSKLGDSMSKVEGVVLRIKAASGDIYEVKGTSIDFANQAKIVWEDRVKINDIEQNFFNRLIKDALKLQVYNLATNTWDSDVSSVKLSKSVAKLLPSIHPAEMNKNSYLKELANYLTPNLQDSLSNIRERLKGAIDYSRQELQQIRENIKSKKEVLDVDSLRKTEDYIQNLNNTLNDYEIILTSKSSPESVFFKTIDKLYGTRIDPMITSKTTVTPTDESRKKIIVWNGRAQPWHKGHDQMIQIGKQKLAEIGADKILIMIIKGASSSEKLDVNPLNEKEQYDLISSIYAGDNQVEVYDKFPSSSFIGTIINKHIYPKGYVVVGWLAGEDRIESYKKFVDTFNPDLFRTDHDYSPIDINPKTGKKVEFIQTPRVMSGTESRELVKTLSFEEWLNKVAPSKISGKAKENYLIVYNKIKSILGGQQIEEIVISTLNETITKRGSKYCLLSKKTKRNLGCYPSKSGAKKREKQVQYFKSVKEMSAVGAGSVTGYAAPLQKDKEEK